MTSYIGNTPGLANRLLWQFTATDNQTVFTGTDNNNLNLNFASYVIDVFVNGVLVRRDTDYTQSNGNTITFTEGLSEDDTVTIIGVGTFNIPDTYTRDEIDNIIRTRVVWRFVSTDNQDTFTGTDFNSVNLDFALYNIDVFVNGNLLTPVVDYTTTGDDTVTISTPLAENDEVLIVGVTLFNLANTYTKNEVDAFIQNVEQQVDSITVTKSDVRQTVNTGPVDGDGRADFLEAGSGLQVVTKDVGSNIPLNITFGDGFDSNGKRDLVTLINSSLSWNNLPDNEEDISLYIKVSRSTGAVSTEASALAPIYSAAEPSAPATGQKWYPTDHRAPMREWDGSEWNADDLIICVGQCSTDGGSVVEVRSYAYQGKYASNFESLTGVDFRIYNHNIGLKNDVSIQQQGRFTANVHGYSIGDIVDVGTWYVAGGSGDIGQICEFGFNFIRVNRSSAYRIPNKNNQNVTTESSYGNIHYRIIAERAF